MFVPSNSGSKFVLGERSVLGGRNNFFKPWTSDMEGGCCIVSTSFVAAQLDWKV